MPPSAPFRARLQQLGNLRCRILACLGADNPRLPAFFDPPEDQPVSDCLHRHLLKLHEAFAGDADSQRIVAAGLLSFGELSRVHEILHLFPAEPTVMDHGAGWCPLIAYSAVSELLPLPKELQDVRRWLQGSTEATHLLQWLQLNYERLSWDGEKKRFTLK
ncbi:MAG TPA: hypothetical protein VML19_23355 [Verrucomicrobiae bacterium]|nr:hypothetical protein [Verrucomicrobiae bacterium]